MGAATAADDSDRMRKVLESRANQDEERMGKLEEELKAARTQAEDADTRPPTDRAGDGRGRSKSAASSTRRANDSRTGNSASNTNIAFSPDKSLASAFLLGSLPRPPAPRRLAVPASFAFSRLTCWILV